MCTRFKRSKWTRCPSKTSERGTSPLAAAALSPGVLASSSSQLQPTETVNERAIPRAMILAMGFLGGDALGGLDLGALLGGDALGGIGLGEFTVLEVQQMVDDQGEPIEGLMALSVRIF